MRKSIGEEADIDGNDYLLEQYMNDMVLVQSFIESKLARDKAKNMSKDGVSIHSRQDFPTLVKMKLLFFRVEARRIKRKNINRENERKEENNNLRFRLLLIRLK